MTLGAFEHTILDADDACKSYLVRRGLLARLAERRGMSEERRRSELDELNASLEAAMRRIGERSGARQ